MSLLVSLSLGLSVLCLSVHSGFEELSYCQSQWSNMFDFDLAFGLLVCLLAPLFDQGRLSDQR